MDRSASKVLIGATGALLAATAAFLAIDRGVVAADHLDPPGRSDPAVDPSPDAAADLADIYAFHDANNLVIAVTFGGPSPTNLPAYYDRDVLYTLHISNDDVPITSEHKIEFRFGQSGGGSGVRITGIPGSTGPIEGPVETNLVQGAIVARAGLFDDPFFFDSAGLRLTRQTGAIMFRNDRCFFCAQNVTAVVLQFPRAAVENGNNEIRIWSDTARFGGQL